jgi:hypothetical protein
MFHLNLHKKNQYKYNPSGNNCGYLATQSTEVHFIIYSIEENLILLFVVCCGVLSQELE